MVFRLLCGQVKLILSAPTRKDFEAARVASGGFVVCLMRRKSHFAEHKTAVSSLCRILCVTSVTRKPLLEELII